MANGNDLGIEEIWEGYSPREDKDQVEYRAKQMSTNIILAKALKPVISETRINTRFRWLFIGAIGVITVVLIPIIIEVMPMFFK